MPTLSEGMPRILPSPITSVAPVLVVAHPGHELRVHGWMERARPLVCVLTDGSGSADEARLESTSGVLQALGARPGPLYGRLSDRALYAGILAGDSDLFCRLADELAQLLSDHGADCVVGDAVEGYNPSHDLCRLVINAAARMARGAGELPGYDFLLVGAPGQCPEQMRERACFLRLDEDALARKLAAADAYPELAGEVAAALAQWGSAPFQVECLRPVDADDRYGWDPAQKPYYETFGEKRVAEGVYPSVLRFREHVMPLADALWSHSERRR